MGSTRGGPDSALSPRALSRVPPVSSAVADALPFPLVTAVDQGLIVDLKLLVFNVSASYARLCASEPELAVAVTDRRVSQHSAELCVGVADAMGQHNLSKVRKGCWADGEARGVWGVACCIWRVVCVVSFVCVVLRMCCGVWCVMCHVSCVMCHVSCVRCGVCGVWCVVWCVVCVVCGVCACGVAVCVVRWCALSALLSMHPRATPSRPCKCVTTGVPGLFLPRDDS